MALKEKLSGRERLVSTTLAVVLTVLSVRSLRNGKRLRGIVAAVGALAFGYRAATASDDIDETIDIDTSDTISDVTGGEATDGQAGATRERASLTCASCGEPITLGQRRGPNANDEIVHESCKEATV